jgi:hypothetical protein
MVLKEEALTLARTVETGNSVPLKPHELTGGAVSEVAVVEVVVKLVV